MIRCSMEWRGGRLWRLMCSGHADINSKDVGVSLACAAVSCSIRSIGVLLEKSGKVVIRVDRFAPGEVDFTVEHVDKGSEQWLRGLSDMLDQSLADVQRDFPGQIALTRFDS